MIGRAQTDNSCDNCQCLSHVQVLFGLVHFVDYLLCFLGNFETVLLTIAFKDWKEATLAKIHDRLVSFLTQGILTLNEIFRKIGSRFIERLFMTFTLRLNRLTFFLDSGDSAPLFLALSSRASVFARLIAYGASGSIAIGRSRFI